jgi:NADP-dependent 3-hydroxy acid dehydrogenase YdfG
MELAGSPIRVSCIEPGLVLTELHRDWKVHPTQALNIPNPLRPDDIARAVRFILEQPPHVSVPRLMMLPSEQAL